MKTAYRAGSLVYATVFILIVSVLCFAFYSLFFYSYESTASFIQLHKTRMNARSGINFLMSQQQMLKEGEIKTISLFNGTDDSVRLEKKYWGALQMLTATAIEGEYTFSLSALVGNQVISDTSFALFLADQNNALVVAGNTEITGNCYLPQGTVKTGYINGQPFTGQKAVYGTLKKSPSSSIEFNKELYNYLQHQFTPASSASDTVIPLQQVNLPDTLKNTFSNRTMVLYSPGVIILDKLCLIGRIKVVSGKKIIVKESASLTDVVLYAPVVKIEKKVKGQLQAFATDTLSTAEGCELYYPSMLGILRTSSSGGHPVLAIGAENKITGDLFALDEKKEYNQHISVRIDEKVIITGRVYSSDIVDFKGKLTGSLACSRIIYANSSAVYENHLFNAKINADKLPAWYVGSSVMLQKSKNGIIKWL